jgi:plastocyanin domain-containing protein
VRLVFTRANAENCGGEVVFPDLDVRRELPVGVAVPVDLTMPASGRVVFSCGMDMYHGAIVAR